MGGKYKGKHVAGNVDRSEATPADEIPEEERLETAAKDRPTAADAKVGAEELKDRSPR